MSTTGTLPCINVMFDCRFVDRDIFMRYLGNGIGHRATNHLHVGAISQNDCNSYPEVAVDEDSDLDELEEEFSDTTESEALLSDEDDDYGYNHNKLMEKELESDEAGEDGEDDDCDSMYMD